MKFKSHDLLLGNGLPETERERRSEGNRRHEDCRNECKIGDLWFPASCFRRPEKDLVPVGIARGAIL